MLSSSSAAMEMLTVGAGDAVFSSFSLYIAELTSEGLLTSWPFVTGLSPCPFRGMSFDQIDLMVFFIPFRRGGYMISWGRFQPKKADSPHVEMISVHYQFGFGPSYPPFVNVEASNALTRRDGGNDYERMMESRRCLSLIGWWRKSCEQAAWFLYSKKYFVI